MSYVKRHCTFEGCSRVVSSGMCPQHKPTAIAFRADMTDPRHGTTNGYCNLACRCAQCAEAWRIKHGQYMSQHPEQMEKTRIRGTVARWGGPNNLAEQGYMRAGTVAKTFDVSVGAINRWADEGRIPVRCHTPGGHRAFHPQDVADFAAVYVTQRVAALAEQFAGLVDMPPGSVTARQVVTGSERAA